MSKQNLDNDVLPETKTLNIFSIFSLVQMWIKANIYQMSRMYARVLTIFSRQFLVACFCKNGGCSGLDDDLVKCSSENKNILKFYSSLKCL